MGGIKEMIRKRRQQDTIIEEQSCFIGGSNGDHNHGGKQLCKTVTYIIFHLLSKQCHEKNQIECKY